MNDARAERDRDLFDRIARDYARKDLEPSSAAARRQRLLQTIAQTPLTQASDLLEVGCGAGFAATYLRGRYRTYTGLDYSAELIRFASERHAGPNVEFHASDFQQFESVRHFDVIVMIGVVHHMTDRSAVMKKACSLLKAGGVLAVNEPQPNNLAIHLLRRFRSRVDRSYSSEQDEMTSDELTQLFEAAGLEQVRTRCQGFLSTPFAEIVIPPQLLTTPASRLACAADRLFERIGGRVLRALSWNVIAVGTKPR